jgi:hypothetical protein
MSLDIHLQPRRKSASGMAPICRTEVDRRHHQRFGTAMDLSEDGARERGTFSAVRRVHHAYFRSTLPGASGEFFHAIGDNLRQLHYPLAQFGVFCNVALNAVAIGL